MLDSSSRSFGHRLVQSRSSSLWNENAVRAGAFGRSQNRAKIARVLDSIKHQNQWFAFAADARGNRIQQSFHVRIRGRRDVRHDSLMKTVPNFAIESRAGSVFYGNAA